MAHKCPYSGFLPIILFILVINIAGSGKLTYDFHKSVCPDPVFIQLRGDIKKQGIFEICSKNKEGLIVIAGIPFLPEVKRLVENLKSGTCLDIINSRNRLTINIHSMSGFFRVALGIPIYLNSDGVEDLIALPGIGPSLGNAIVKARQMRGGFQSIEDIRNIKGISERVFERISPFLELENPMREYQTFSFPLKEK